MFISGRGDNKLDGHRLPEVPGPDSLLQHDLVLPFANCPLHVLPLADPGTLLPCWLWSDGPHGSSQRDCGWQDEEVPEESDEGQGQTGQVDGRDTQRDQGPQALRLGAFLL